MKMILKLVILLLLLLLGLGIGALLRSGAPLSGPPGVMERLQRYLSENVAETTAHGDYPELGERHYQLAPDPMLEQVLDTFESLGWQTRHSDPRRRMVDATLTTPLLGFTDDFTVTIHPRPGNGSRLAIRSASRVGRADFGANIGHILAFVGALEQRLPAEALLTNDDTAEN